VTIREKIMQSRFVSCYYRAQYFVDIGWGEFSWFSNALLEMMAVCYFLERIGLEISGMFVIVVLVLVFVVTYLFGRLFKKIGLYDKSVYVGSEINPWQKEILEAARLIKKHSKEKK